MTALSELAATDADVDVTALLCDLRPTLTGTVHGRGEEGYDELVSS